MNASDFNRRILLVVTGLTPQVVTETLYALAISEQQKFVPTEIHVITTAEGAQIARLSLLDAQTGKFNELCRDYNLTEITFSSSNIHVIPDKNGKPLLDIRTPDDNLCAADFISQIVRNFCSEDNTALHVSIAGGRKSMGFFIGYALSLFGRSQDTLSHVLVNQPFESLNDFFYPPKDGRVLYDRNQRPAHTDDAYIMLADIPFVRLRGGVPASLLSGNASFAETVDEIQSGLNFINLNFNIKQHSICCGEQWIKLPPSLFSFYFWLAKRSVAGLACNGAISWREANHLDFLSIYAEVVGGLSAHLDAAKKSLEKGFENGEFFEQKASKINAILKKNIPLNASAYMVLTSGTKTNKKYGLKITADFISY